MSHPVNQPGKLEVKMLNAFKGVVVSVMILLLLVTVWFVLAGVLVLPFKSETTSPEQKASSPTFSPQQFLDTLTPAVTKGESREASKDDSKEKASEAKFVAHVQAMWPAVEKYMQQCGKSVLTQDEFIETLRSTNLSRVLTRQGDDYAASQIAFVQKVLSTPDFVSMCKQGRSGLFLNMLEWHRTQWIEQSEAAKEFEYKERKRVHDFNEAERMRVEAAKAGAIQSFMMAAVAFGLFMSVALLLIFARIESNLRNVQIVVSSGGMSNE